jgi:hypothetical protein
MVYAPQVEPELFLVFGCLADFWQTGKKEDEREISAA